MTDKDSPPEECEMTLLPQEKSFDQRMIQFAWRVVDDAPLKKTGWIGLYVPTQQSNRQYCDFFKIKGEKAGKGCLAAQCFGYFELRYFSDGGYEKKATSKVFLLGPEMPLQVEFQSDDEIVVKWDSSKETENDWVGLYKADESNNSAYIETKYTCHAKEKGVSFQMKEPGRYVVRYFFGNKSTGGTYSHSGVSKSFMFPAVKIVLAGGCKSGVNSTLLQQFIQDRFQGVSSTTFGTVCLKKYLVVDDFLLKLEVWDIDSQLHDSVVFSNAIKDSAIVIAGFDVTRKDSFAECKGLIEKLHCVEKYNGTIVAVGNKIDLVGSRVVTSDEALKCFAEMNPPIPYFESSAESGEGVNELFENSLRIWIDPTKLDMIQESVKEKKAKKVIGVALPLKKVSVNTGIKHHRPLPKPAPLPKPTVSRPLPKPVVPEQKNTPKPSGRPLPKPRNNPKPPSPEPRGEAKKELEQEEVEHFKLEAPKEAKDCWSDVLPLLANKVKLWKDCPLLSQAIDSNDGVDDDESMFVCDSFQEPKRITQDDDIVLFGAPGTQVPVNSDLKATIRLSHRGSSKNKVSFKVVTRKGFNYKYSLEATPSDGTLTSGQSVDIKFVLKVLCTTSLDIQIPVVMLYGGMDAFDKLVVNGGGKETDVFVCMLKNHIQSLPSTRLDLNELILNRPAVGQGGNGVVYRGTYRGMDVACKILKNQECMTVEEFRDFKREVEMFDALRHPKVVTFVGAVIVPRSLCVVTQFCPYGSLDSAIPKFGRSVWTMKMKTKALLDAALAMQFLHQSRIIYRDLKPANLLVVSLEVNSADVCKLTDFGTSKGTNSMADLGMTKAQGTPLYEAPEVLKGSRDYDNKVDVFSFGISMAFVADDRDPYKELSCKSSWEFTNAVIEGKRPTVMSDVPAEYSSLMSACWNAEPSKRPDFNVIVDALTSLFNTL